MKYWMLVVAALLVAAPSFAQDTAPVVSPSAPSGALALGGIPQLIANKLTEAKAAGLVDFAGHVGGGGYVPTYTFHDKAGVSYVEVAGIGYRVLQGQKPCVLLVPVMVDVTALSGRAWNFPWAHDHVTRSAYPDIFLGPGIILPGDHAQLAALNIKRPQDWTGLVGSVRFK